MILAFETVARTASACVGPLGEAPLACEDLGGAEAEVGLPALLDRLLRGHPGVQALALAAGPGSFTGLRVGITAARTLGWLHGLGIHCVDSLQALALQAGDGCWWVLMPLKRDTTFHGLFAVAGGRLEVLEPTTAWPDASPPPWIRSLDSASVPIGPALLAKPQLLQDLGWTGRTGSPARLQAGSVLLAAAMVPARPWQECLPAYHQEPAPVIQRQGLLAKER